MDEILCNNLQQNSMMHAPLADNLGAELLQAAHKPVDDFLGEEVDSLKSTVEKLQGSIEKCEEDLNDARKQLEERDQSLLHLEQLSASKTEEVDSLKSTVE